MPPWVLRVVRDVADTKASMRNVDSQLTTMSARLDTFVTRQEYGVHVAQSEELIRTKLNPLWDSHNAILGRQENQERNEKWWRYGTSLALGALSLWAVLRQAGVF